MEKLINKLQIRYRTYTVEFEVDEGAVMLPKMFEADFGHQISRYVTLEDRKGNEFEVLIEKHNGCVYLTKGWLALQDFYGITLGAWISMVWLGHNKFYITIKDRFKFTINYPTFVPSMKFKVNKIDVVDYVIHGLPTPYIHDMFNFQFSTDKILTSHDVADGYLILPYAGFCEMTLTRETVVLMLVDDCGNLWNCVLIYGSLLDEHLKIGGEWKRMVAARRIVEGMHVIIGAPFIGTNSTLYVTINRS